MRRQAHRKGAWLCLMGGRQWQAVQSGHREVKVGNRAQSKLRNQDVQRSGGWVSCSGKGSPKRKAEQGLCTALRPDALKEQESMRNDRPCGKLQCRSKLSSHSVTLVHHPSRLRNQVLDNAEESPPAEGAGGDHTAVHLYRVSLACPATRCYLRCAAK